MRRVTETVDYLRLKTLQAGSPKSNLPCPMAIAVATRSSSPGLGRKGRVFLQQLALLEGFDLRGMGLDSP